MAKKRRYTSEQLRTIRGIIWEMLERNRYELIALLPSGYNYYFLPSVIGISNSFRICSASVMIMGEGIQDKKLEINIGNVRVDNWSVKPSICISLYVDLPQIEAIGNLILKFIEPLTKLLKVTPHVLLPSQINEVEVLEEQIDDDDKEIIAEIKARMPIYKKQAKEFRQKVLDSKDRYKITMYTCKNGPIKYRSHY